MASNNQNFSNGNQSGMNKLKLENDNLTKKCIELEKKYIGEKRENSSLKEDLKNLNKEMERLEYRMAEICQYNNCEVTFMAYNALKKSKDEAYKIIKQLTQENEDLKKKLHFMDNLCDESEREHNRIFERLRNERNSIRNNMTNNNNNNNSMYTNNTNNNNNNNTNDNDDDNAFETYMTHLENVLRDASDDSEDTSNNFIQSESSMVYMLVDCKSDHDSDDNDNPNNSQ